MRMPGRHSEGSTEAPKTTEGGLPPETLRNLVKDLTTIATGPNPYRAGKVESLLQKLTSESANRIYEELQSKVLVDGQLVQVHPNDILATRPPAMEAAPQFIDRLNTLKAPAATSLLTKVDIPPEDKPEMIANALSRLEKGKDVTIVIEMASIQHELTRHAIEAMPTKDAALLLIEVAKTDVSSAAKLLMDTDQSAHVLIEVMKIDAKLAGRMLNDAEQDIIPLLFARVAERGAEVAGSLRLEFIRIGIEKASQELKDTPEKMRTLVEELSSDLLKKTQETRPDIVKLIYEVAPLSRLQVGVLTSAIDKTVGRVIDIIKQRRATNDLVITARLNTSEAAIRLTEFARKDSTVAAIGLTKLTKENPEIAADVMLKMVVNRQPEMVAEILAVMAKMDLTQISHRLAGVDSTRVEDLIHAMESKRPGITAELIVDHLSPDDAALVIDSACTGASEVRIYKKAAASSAKFLGTGTYNGLANSFINILGYITGALSFGALTNSVTVSLLGGLTAVPTLKAIAKSKWISKSVERVSMAQSTAGGIMLGALVKFGLSPLLS